LFVYWVYKELGIVAGVTSLLFMACSEWLTLFSGNIFWNIWAFYLPLISSSIYLMKSEKTENYNSLLLGIIFTTVMYLKCLFTGFEYITTALIMPLTPFVFYSVRDSWGWRKFTKRIFQSSIGLLTGVFAGLTTLTWQIHKAQGGVSEAIATILAAFFKRSLGNPSQYAEEAESLNASLIQVLNTYVNGRAISLTRILHIEKHEIEITYLHILLLFFIVSIVLIITIKNNASFKKYPSSRAIIITTWVSILAPLSWFIIFKAHSYIHTQMNFIIWQMPFTLYGFALSGHAIHFLFLSFKNMRRPDQIQ